MVRSAGGPVHQTKVMKRRTSAVLKRKSVFSDIYWILGAPRCCFPTWQNLGSSFLKVLREMYAYKACVIRATSRIVVFGNCLAF